MRLPYQFYRRMAAGGPDAPEAMPIAQRGYLHQSLHYFRTMGQEALYQQLLLSHSNPALRFHGLMRAGREEEAKKIKLDRRPTINRALIELAAAGDVTGVERMRAQGGDMSYNRYEALAAAASHGHTSLLLQMMGRYAKRRKTFTYSILSSALKHGQRETLHAVQRRYDGEELPATVQDPWELHPQEQTLDAKAEQLMGALLPTLTIACGMEGIYPELAERFARSLSRMFDTEAEVERYLNHTEHLADLMQFAVPTAPDWPREDWKPLLLEHGIQAAQHINAGRNREFHHYLHRGPRDVAEYRLFLQCCETLEADLNTVFGSIPAPDAVEHFLHHRDAYMEYGPRVREQEVWAQICKEKLINERGFQQGCDALPHIKHTERVPSVFIDGAALAPHFKLTETKEKLEDFVFITSADPYLGLTVGKDVGNCNHVGYGRDEAEDIVFGAGRQAVAQVTDPDTALMVLKRKCAPANAKDKSAQEIVGKVTAWRSSDGQTLVFNSWQDKGPRDFRTRFGSQGRFTMLAEAFLTMAAVQCLQREPQLHCVNIGVGKHARGSELMGMPYHSVRVEPAHEHSEYKRDAWPQRTLAERTSDGHIITKFFTCDPRDKSFTPEPVSDYVGTRWEEQVSQRWSEHRRGMA